MSLSSVSIGNREYRVNINDQGSEVDGRPVQASLVPINGGYLLRRDNQSVELHLSAEDAETLRVIVGGHQMRARVMSSRRGSARAAVVRQGVLTAPMHGLVVDVLVSEGESVLEGQTLVVLESMKMQMTLRAPLGGRVRTTATKKGARVEKGDLLVQIDPDQ
jgi:biotin carboxyl carrier protein